MVCSKRISVPQAQQFVSVHGNDTMVSLPPVSNPATPRGVNGEDSSRVLACPPKWSAAKEYLFPRHNISVSVHGKDTMVSLPPVSNPATPWVVNGKNSSRVLAVIQNTGGRSSRNLLICMGRNDSGSIKPDPFLFAAKTFYVCLDIGTEMD
ncbi:hypothetical protein CDAR_436761 [Caerostris darwini]|uniref:Uncharacterized protein n=1 Tax=Caerostris darwini TaxID=1538125 RepID=A0AAV4SQF6_9ARAC|nr:hypothetical protein CDAR_436761 [Caerostris darwini]